MQIKKIIFVFSWKTGKKLLLAAREKSKLSKLKTREMLETKIRHL